MSTTAGFVNLHVHSEYSFLDGLARVPQIVQAAKNDGAEAVAVSDHGSQAGLWSLGVYARAAGIKPIMAEEMYLAYGSRWDPEIREISGAGSDTDGGGEGERVKRKAYQHLTVIAASETGWKNLVAIHNKAQASTIAHYGETYALMDYALLAEHAEGLIVLTGCLGGPVMGPMARGDVDGAREGLQRVIDAVGRENTYVEIMEHGIPEESAVLPAMVDLAREFGVDFVATNDSHYARAEDAYTHEAWLAVQRGKTMLDPAEKRFTFHGAGYHLRGDAETRALRPEHWWQEACDTSVAIARRIAEDVLPKRELRLPTFPVPEGFDTSLGYLDHLLKERLREKFGDDVPQVVRDRCNFERSITRQKGIADYWLILWDLIAWCRSPEVNILVGFGRGSAGGSYIAYLLGITMVDPIENDLMFERFLDMTRTEMPDIDTDFERARLDEVRSYLVAKYGRKHVVRIGSFATMKSKAAIKAAAKVMGRKADVGNALAKALPMKGAVPYEFSQVDEEAATAAAGFFEAVEHHRAQDVLAMARTFEGVASGLGIHACGVIISDEDLTTMIPLRTDRRASAPPDAPMVTEWNAKGVGDGGIDEAKGEFNSVGLMKLDVLGLRNLDIVAACLANVERRHGTKLDLLTLPGPEDLHDPNVVAAWETIATGRTAGVFQLDSEGMTALARKVAPNSLDHVSALVALYRPGPLDAGAHEIYAARKTGREPVDYGIFTDDLAEQEVIASVLGSTYGVAVYQEQMMRLGDVIAGFDAAERNALRRAVSKKDEEVIRQTGVKFIAGAMSEVAIDGTPKRAFSRAAAESLWATIRGAGSYAFNKSHSATYGLLAYVTAYLKTTYPSDYAAALLAVIDRKDHVKRAVALRSIREESIKVLPPDLNLSFLKTAPVDDETVAFGLGEVKDIGAAAASIVAERETNGPFTSLGDVVRRTRIPGKDGKAPSTLSSTVLKALISCGAADSFGPRRGHMAVASALAKRNDTEPLTAEWGMVDRAVRQHNYLGLIFGEHPMEVLAEQTRDWRWATTAVDRYTGEEESQVLEPVPLGEIGVTIAGKRSALCTIGVITSFKEKISKRSGKPWALAEISSEDTTMTIRLWESTLTAARSAFDTPLGVGSVVAVNGRVEEEEYEREDDEGGTYIEVVRSMSIFKVAPVPYVDPGVIDPEPVDMSWLSNASCDLSNPPQVPVAPARKPRAKKAAVVATEVVEQEDESLFPDDSGMLFDGFDDSGVEADERGSVDAVAAFVQAPAGTVVTERVQQVVTAPEPVAAPTPIRTAPRTSLVRTEVIMATEISRAAPWAADVVANPWGASTSRYPTLSDRPGNPLARALSISIYNGARKSVAEDVAAVFFRHPMPDATGRFGLIAFYRRGLSPEAIGALVPGRDEEWVTQAGAFTMPGEWTFAPGAAR